MSEKNKLGPDTIGWQVGHIRGLIMYYDSLLSRLQSKHSQGEVRDKEVEDYEAKLKELELVLHWKTTELENWLKEKEEYKDE